MFVNKQVSVFSGWISVSVGDFHTVEAQPGETVTLSCNNFTSFISHIYWFKLGQGSNTSCISFMISSNTNASMCVGFPKNKFITTSNMSTIFLEIKSVDLFDSGLYFCGVYSYGKSAVVHATYLKVQGKFV